MRGLGIALACLAFFGGCGGGGSDEAQPGIAPAPVPESEEKAAPQLEGVTLDGKRLALSDFRGRPLMLNVWSSW